MTYEPEEFKAIEVTSSEGETELERLLTDPRFKATERSRAFLRYIAAQRFTGDTKGVKAYTIALDVFGRSTDFDPLTDPIVRIEATRLRAALDTYYASIGADRPIRIHLPRGHYIAEFERLRPPDAELVPKPAVPDAKITGEPQVDRPSPFSVLGKSVVGTAVAVGLLTAGFLATKPPKAVRQLAVKPLVRLSVSARNPADKDAAEEMEDELVASLIGFSTLRLSAVSDVVEKTTSSVGSAPSASKDEGYDVSLKYSSDKDSRSVSWRITETDTGQTRSSGEERVERGDPYQVSNDPLLLILAQRFGAAVGELNTLELAKIQGQPNLGNRCVLEAESAISFYDSVKINQVVPCLEQTLRESPADADVSAVLSRVLLFQDAFAGIEANSQRALLLADKAVAAAPSSDRAQVARISALYALGRRDEAIALGREAIRRSPYNKDLAAVVGVRMFLAGDAQEGVERVQNAGMIDAIRPRSTLIVLAMSQYCDGNAAKTVQLLQDVPVDGGLVEATRIAALARLNRRPEAVAAFARVLGVKPSFRVQMDALVQAPYFNAHLGTMLKADLDVAGRWYSEDSASGKLSVN